MNEKAKREIMASAVLRGYNQLSLAKALGISKNALNRKINGHSEFKREEISNLCLLLHITDPAKKVELFGI